MAAPLIGLAAVTLASTIIGRSIVSPDQTFVGDLIVVLYLLTMPAMAVVLGSFASQNPLASLGGSREMKLIMSYELPLVLVAFVPVIQTHSIRLGDILSAGHLPIAHLSGIVALLVAIVCTQAKLTQVPFDMPEAETELAGGAYVEYSGPPLAIFKLTRAMMTYTMPLLLIAIFWGGIPWQGGWGPVAMGVVKYVILVALAVLIRNTAPRVRIDQAVRFFWGPVTVAGLAAVALALAGW
jgi:NADH-quinone oxidoreductase subunit H